MANFIHDKLSENSKIAVYLRKSREDEKNEDTLGKHRLQLTEYVKSNGLTNVEWYEEVGSADSISKRPVFLELLSLVEENTYDAVLIVHYDRLSRGSQIDNGIITQTFKDTDTLILTPERVYDLSEESAELMSEVEGLLSRAEYRSIKRRLYLGKVNATKQGKHATGILPYPYKRDKNTDTVYVDEEQKKVFDFVVESYLSGHNIEAIAVELNKRGIKTARGRTWHSNQVYRMLTLEFHRGYVVLGRTKRDASGKQVPQTDSSKIIRVRGNHPVLVDEETARAIDRILAQNSRNPPKSRAGTYSLSGIIRCGFCGATIGFSRSKGRIYLRKCFAFKPDRIHRCTENKGLAYTTILDMLKRDMYNYRERLFAERELEPKPRVGLSVAEINRNIIKESTEKLDRLKTLYVDGVIDRAEFNERKTTIDKQLMDAKQALSELSIGEEEEAVELAEIRKKSWKNIDLDELFSDSIPYQTKNRIFKSVIDHITYKRVNKTVELDIVYK